MSTSAPPAPAGTPPVAHPPPTAGPTPLQPLPAELQPFADDLRAFYHALPGLLAEEDAGYYAVVHGGQVHGTWDTYRDATQYGLTQFSMGRFLTQRVDPRMLDALATVFGPLPAAEGG